MTGSGSGRLASRAILVAAVSLLVLGAGAVPLAGTAAAAGQATDANATVHNQVPSPSDTVVVHSVSATDSNGATTGGAVVIARSISGSDNVIDSWKIAGVERRNSLDGSDVTVNLQDSSYGHSYTVHVLPLGTSELNGVNAGDTVGTDVGGNITFDDDGSYDSHQDEFAGDHRMRIYEGSVGAADMTVTQGSIDSVTVQPTGTHLAEYTEPFGSEFRVSVSTQRLSAGAIGVGASGRSRASSIVAISSVYDNETNGGVTFDLSGHGFSGQQTLWVNLHDADSSKTVDEDPNDGVSTIVGYDLAVREGASGGMAVADSFTLTVQSSDLQVAGVTPQDGGLVAGDQLSVDATVENQGNAATSSQTVALEVDPEQDGTFTQVDTTTVNVAAGSSQGVTLTYDSAVADAPGVDVRVTTEDDAAGATATATLPAPSPDSITDGTASPSAVDPGQSSTITATVVTASGTPLPGVNVSFAANGAGSLTVVENTSNATGEVTATYTGAVGDEGSTVDVTVEAADAAGVSGTTVPVAVNDVEHAPTAADDAYATDEDTELAATTTTLLANDTDLDGNELTASPVPVSGPSHGTVTIGSDGTFAYAPNANFSGTDTFTYRVFDGTERSDTATATITVNPVNDAPDASGESYAVPEDGTLDLVERSVLANDADVDGDDLTATVVSGPAHGDLSMNGDGTFEYEPAPDYNGPDSFTYRASDGNGGTATATVTLDVTAKPDAPAAGNDTYTVDEDGGLTAPASVLANDADADGDDLSVSTPAVSGPSNGTLSLAPDGTFVYTPNANFNGDDAFTYEVYDGTGRTDTATATVTVEPVNDAPVAADESYEVLERETLTVAAPGVLTNASDVDGDSLSASLADAPDHGTVQVNADGSLTYDHAPGFTGVDSFTYQVSDGNGGTDAATVTVDVLDRPNFTVDVAHDGPVGVEENVTVTANVTNVGEVNGTQTVSLAVEGEPVDETSVTLTPNASTDVTFEYHTDANDLPSVPVEVASANETTSATVDVAAGDGPVPVTECLVIDWPGTYALTGDLASDSTCIGVTASDVTVDGAGHDIEYTGEGESPSVGDSELPGGPFGVAVNGAENVTVRDVTTSRWLAGVVLNGTEDATVRDVDSGAGLNGVGIVDSRHATVRAVNASQNRQAGIVVANATDTLVADSTVTRSRQYGIAVGESSDDTAVRNNSVDSAGAAGIYVQGSTDVALAENRVRESGVGIALDRSPGASVAENVVTKTAGFGIVVDAADATLADNVVVAAAQAGGENGDRSEPTPTPTPAPPASAAVAIRGTGATLHNTTVVRPGGSGLTVSEANATVSDLAVRNGTASGVVLVDDGTDATLTDATVSDVGGVGLRVATGDNRVRNVTVTRAATGVSLATGERAGSVLANVTAVDTRRGVVVDGRDHVLRAVTVENASAADAAGIRLVPGADNVTVTDAAVANASTHGIAVVDGADHRIVDAAATGNGGAGLAVLGASGGTVVTGLTATENRHGLVANSSNITITDASVNRNAGDGIRLVGPAANVTVAGSRAANNSAAGIALRNATGVALRGTVVAENDGPGLALRGTTDATDLEGVTARNNRVGIAVNATDTDVRNSRLVGNARDGLWVATDAADTTVAETTSSRNGRWAVNATAGTAVSVDGLDLGDSTASDTTLDGTLQSVRLRGVDGTPGSPAGRTDIGRYFVAEDASADATLDLVLHYADGDLGGVSEGSLDLYHTTSDGWAAVQNATVNTTRNRASATVSNFSTFGLFGTVPNTGGGGGGAPDLGNPSITVTETTLSDTSVDPGDTVTVGVELSNDGTGGGTRTVHLRVDGERVDSQDARVGAGQNWSVQLTFEPTEAGEYELVVDNETVGTVTVGDAGAGGTNETDGTEPTATPGDDGTATSTATASSDGGGAPTPDTRDQSGLDGSLLLIIGLVGLAVLGSLGLLANRR